MKNPCFVQFWQDRSPYKISQLQLISNSCCNHHRETIICADCRDVCPENALELHNYPEINAEKCHFCGLCVAACQPGAIIFPQLFSKNFLKEIAEKVVEKQYVESNEIKPSIVITCRGVPENKPGIPEPFICLASFDEGHFIQFFSRGTKHLIIDCSSCGDCRNKKGLPYIQKRVNETNSWMQALDIEGKIEISFAQSQATGRGQDVTSIIHESPVSRRKYLLNIYKKGLHKVVERLGDAEEGVVKEDRTFSVAEKRNLLFKFFHQDQIADSPDLPGNLSILHVSVNENCTLCDECYVRCPGNALLLKGNQYETTLSFHPLRCLGCDHCMELCPQNALSARKLKKNDFPLEIRVVATAKKSICVSCEKPFIKTDETDACLPCSKHKEMDEEIWRSMSFLKQ